MKKILSFLMVALFSTAMFAEEHTYTVVGGSTALFGETWKPAYAANDMTLVEENVYTITFENKILPAGDIEYKIARDHDWDVAYPQTGNASFNISEAGKYDVTFTLDLTKNPQYSVEATKKGEAEVDDVAQLAGTFNSWTPADMTLSGDKSKASIKVNLAKGSYDFKVVINDGWHGDGHAFTRNDSVLAGLEANSENMSITTDVKGEYTFTWTFATKTLVISYPKLAKSALTFAGSDHISLTVRVDGGNLTTGAEVEEKKTVLLTTTINDEDYYLNSIRAYKTTDSETEVTITDNSFTMPDYPVTIVVVESKRLLENGFYLNGTHVKWAIADLAPYKFVANSEVEGEYLLENVTLTVDQEIKACYVENDNVADDKWYGNGAGNDNVTIDAEKAGICTVYFKPAGDEAWGGHLYIAPNTTTAIDNTAVEAKAVKTLENGMLIIEKNGVRYTVLGQAIH